MTTGFTLRYDPAAADIIGKLAKRDLDIVRDNLLAIREDPRGFGSHPSGLSRAKFKAWQHKCPHSWVVLFRWRGGDETHPSGIITIEDLVECYG